MAYLNLPLSNIRYWVLLIGAFLLEMAGYIAFPYISLQLRDGAGLNEKTIGLIFLAAIWLRPVWSILGGYLSERIAPIYIFAAACLAEASCFFFLTQWLTPVGSTVAIVLGNMGLSLWNPNLYALIFKWYGTENSTKRISMLNGASNCGSAAGCLVGALISVREVQIIFGGAALLYLMCIPILGYFLYSEKPTPKDNAYSPRISLKRNYSEFIGPVFIALGFWASYSQFNSFFALYANDWLKSNTVTGLAFGGVAIGVAFFSILIAKLKNLESKVSRFSLIAVVGFALSWNFLIFSDSGIRIPLFIIAIAWAETLFAPLLAAIWANMDPNRVHLMQGYNFAIRNIAMGLGSLIGGQFYHSPNSGASLAPWAIENSFLLFLCMTGLIFIKLRKPSHTAGSNL